MDDNVFIGDNSKTDSLILSELWKNYEFYIYLIMKLGYYVEEENSFAWLKGSKDGIILIVIIQILVKTITIFNYWFKLTKKMVKKLKECESEVENEEDLKKNKKKK